MEHKHVSSLPLTSGKAAQKKNHRKELNTVKLNLHCFITADGIGAALQSNAHTQHTRQRNLHCFSPFFSLPLDANLFHQTFRKINKLCRMVLTILVGSLICFAAKNEQQNLAGSPLWKPEYYLQVRTTQLRGFHLMRPYRPMDHRSKRTQHDAAAARRPARCRDG